MVNVYIAEDSELVRRELVDTMPWQDMGCSVIGESGNGAQAYKEIQQLKPDILLTDIRMPEMSGLEIIQKLQPEYNMMYVIISAYGEFDYAVSALRLGVKNYLLKPVDDEMLKKTVEQLVKQIENNDIAEKCKLYSNYVNEAVDYIQKCYMMPITIQQISDNLYISESYLSRLFRKETGNTVNDYITQVRIKHACDLLDKGQYKVYEVAEKVGYKDQKYFSEMFKRVMHINPAEYKSR